MATQPAAQDNSDLLSGIPQQQPAAAAPQDNSDLVSGIPTPPQHWYDTAVNELGELSAGVRTGLNQTGRTGMDAVQAAFPIVQAAPGWQQSQQQTEQYADQPLNTPGRKAGDLIENIIEFAAGDEALKGASMAVKLKELGTIEQTLNKSPVLTRMLGNAVRLQTVGTAQAATHGQTGGQAVASGSLTAVGGTALEAVGEAGSKLLNLIRPSTTEVLGEQLPMLASQRAGASPVASDVASIRSEPQIAAEQIQKGQQAIENRAQAVAAQELDKLNAARRTRWEQGQGTMNLAPEAEPLPPGRQLPTGQPQLPANTGGEAAPQLEAGGQPTGITPTAQVGPYEGDFEEQSQAGAAAQPAGPQTPPARPGQPVSYIEERPPNFEPIDSQGEVQNVRSFGEAADVIRKHAAPIFQKLDDLTNGEYTRLRGIRDDAYAINDYRGVNAAEKAITDLFPTIYNKVDSLDYNAGKSAWRTSKILDAVHNEVSKAFNIQDVRLAEDAGPDVWRGISGRRLTSGVNRLVRDYGRTPLEKVIGSDGLTGLLRLGHLTQSPQAAAEFGQKVGDAANELVGGPASAAKLPGYANWMRKVLLHRMAVSPKFANAVDFAVSNRVPGAAYAPILRKMVGLSTQQQQEEQNLQQQPAAGAP